MRTLTLTLSHKWERVILISVLILVGTAQCAVPTYGLRPSEESFLGNIDEEAVLETNQEKKKIIESVEPLREEREKNLHPFVEPAVVDKDLKPTPANFSSEDIRLRESASSFAKASEDKYGDSRSRIETQYPAKKPEPKCGINFALITIIVLAFLSAYFFIKPKSK